MFESAKRNDGMVDEKIFKTTKTYGFDSVYFANDRMEIFGTVHNLCQTPSKSKLQIVRLTCFKLYTDHSELLFLNLKILNVYKINHYLCSFFMYRYNYGKKLSDLYINYFKQNKKVHNYDTRNRNKLHASYK